MTATVRHIHLRDHAQRQRELAKRRALARAIGEGFAEAWHMFWLLFRWSMIGIGVTFCAYIVWVTR